MGEIYEKGQVVIPKNIRDMFKLAPGSKVSFHVEDNRIILEPQYNVLEEFEKLCSEATASDEETFRLIEKLRKKRQKEWLNVPGR